MHPEIVSKTVRCPHCDNVFRVKGMPGEKITLTCSKCGTKGAFLFPRGKGGKQKTYGPPKPAPIVSDHEVIEVKNLTKRYKDVVAVDDISFTVRKGEIFGFLGPNGAGKTTTIRTLLGFLKPDDGETYIFGKNIKEDIVAIRRNVGYIPGELALYEHLTGRQFLEYFSSIRNTELSLLKELSEIFELPLERKIKGYSKGMKQKLGIVQAFMDDPKIVIMDEPTSGLDPLLQQKFYAFLRKEKQRGRTIFFSSHILSEVDRICDRVAIIRNGRIVALEDIGTLKRKTGKKIRLKIAESPEALIASSQVTLVDGWLEITVQDDVDEWIKRIAGYTITDLEIQEFDLEDYFMHYYTSEGRR